MVKHVVVAVDGSKQSDEALEWAIDNFVKGDGLLELVCVLSPISYPVTPTAPIATAGAVAAISQSWENQKRQVEENAQNVLTKAKELVLKNGVPNERVTHKILPAAGGASGVADSIVKYVELKKPDLVVIGSRGMGSVKRSLMSFLGLGSVSDYTVHNVHCPVAVYHPPKSSSAAENVLNETRKDRQVLVAIDDSPHSAATLEWALTNLLEPTDQVHFVSVALPIPYPIVDETSAAVAMLESRDWEQQKDDSLKRAFEICHKAVEAAATRGIPRDHIWYKNLVPEGGASDVGQSICHYAKDNHVDLVVLGSRGMGALARGMMSFIGLGSVSDFCVHNLECPAIVYRA